MFTRDDAWLYGKWWRMHSAATDPYSEYRKQFIDNHGKIPTCDWSTYREFRSWVDDNIGIPVDRTLHLMRHNLNDGFIDGNLYWGHPIDARVTRSRVCVIEYQGKKYTIGQLARKYDVKVSTAYSRFKRGWSVERIIGI